MKTLFAAIVAFFVFNSCTCRNLDCEYDDTQVNFVIRDADTDKDIFFGPDRQYKSDSLKAYLVADSTELAVKRGRSAYTNAGDSIITVFISSAQSFVLTNGSTFIDTITVRPVPEKTKCCGTIIRYKGMGYRGNEYSWIQNYYFVLRR